MVEIVFLMLVMKLPIVYLVAVVWYAIRAEPRPLEPAAVRTPPEPAPWQPQTPRSPRPRRGGPHGRPSRRPVAAHASFARASRS